MAIPSPWLAVEALGDRVGQARALRRLYDDFHAGQAVQGVRAVVAQSWERSGRAGIDPDGHRPPVVLDDAAIEDRWHRHPLYPILPVLRELLSDATSRSGHMLVISDAQGVLLWMEGHRRVMEATEDMHFVVGADWSEGGAGTNALGTAIAVDHPVQIFSAEHFSRIVHPWQCSGAPIHDPETGEILGVIDLTGHLKTAHPHTLALVTAAAGMAEAFLRQDLERRRVLLRERYAERARSVDEATALVDARGAVLEARPAGWLRGPVALAPEGGEVRLPGGAAAACEPLGDDAFVLVRRRPAAARGAPAGALRLDLLRRPPRAVVGGVETTLSNRHAELLAVLALTPAGLTSEELALELYGEAGRPVSARAELSRLRRLLGDAIATKPYRLAPGAVTDVAEVERLLDRGAVAEALERHAQPLLPRSEVPLIVEARERLEGRLRRAVLETRDPLLVNTWCASAAGREDEPAARLLLDLVDGDDALAAEGAARVRRLERVHAAPADPPAW